MGNVGLGGGELPPDDRQASQTIWWVVLPLRGARWHRNHEVEAAIRRKDDVGDDDDDDELSIYDDNGQAKTKVFVFLKRCVAFVWLRLAGNVIAATGEKYYVLVDAKWGNLEQDMGEHVRR